MAGFSGVNGLIDWDLDIVGHVVLGFGRMGWCCAVFEVKHVLSQGVRQCLSLRVVRRTEY